MAKINSRAAPFKYPVLLQAGGGPYVATLTDDMDVDNVGPRQLVLDPSDDDYDVTIPDAVVAHNGDQFEVRNSGTAGFGLTVKNATGTTLVTLANGELAFIRNASGTYTLYRVQGTTSGDSDDTDKTVGGRINDFTSSADTITAAASAAAYKDFPSSAVVAGGQLKAGSRLSILAPVYVSNAAAGTATLKTKLTIGPREVWTYVIATATGAEAYGVNLTSPGTDSIVITSAASTSKILIAAQIAAAWNADAGCSAVATAVSDGVDKVTFTSITDRYFSIAEDENAAKTTLTQTVSATTLVETTAVDQAADDFQALDFELNSNEVPSSASELVGIGTWTTKTGSTVASNVAMLLPTDLATDGDLIVRCWALWSAADATTTARLGFISARVE